MPTLGKGVIGGVIIIALFAMRVVNKMERKGYFDSSPEQHTAVEPPSSHSVIPPVGSSFKPIHASRSESSTAPERTENRSSFSISYAGLGKSGARVTVHRDGVRVEPKAVLAEITNESVKSDQFQTRFMQTNLFQVAAPKVHPSNSFIFVSARYPATIQSWDLKKAKLIDSQNLTEALGKEIGPGNYVSCLNITSDGKKLLAGSSEGEIWIFNISSTGAMQYDRSYHGHSEDVTIIATSPTGHDVVSTSRSKKARSWNVLTCRENFATPPMQNEIQAVRFVDNEQLWLTDGKAFVCCKPDTGEQIQQFEIDRFSSRQPIAFSRSGSDVVLTNLRKHKRYSTSNGEFQSLISEEFFPEFVSYTHDDTQIISASRHKISIRDPDGELASEIEIKLQGSRLTGVESLSDGSLVLVTDFIYGQIWHLTKK